MEENLLVTEASEHVLGINYFFNLWHRKMSEAGTQINVPFQRRENPPG